MTGAEAQWWVARQLEQLYSAREAANIADWVLEYVTGHKRIDRIMHNRQSLPAAQMEKLNGAVSQLLQHKPVQYVTQQAFFAGCSFFVNEAVLIPRPETEELVDWILTDVGHRKTYTGHILDLGTGSGCIPITLKKNLPETTVYGIDSSKEALTVAQQNAVALETTVHFREWDLLTPSPIPGWPKMDIIVSNPPYIPLEEKIRMDLNVVNFEPSMALFVPDDQPLIFYEAIAGLAATQLIPGGFIYVEMHEDFAEKTKTLFVEKGFEHILIKQDMQGKQRMLKARKKN